METPLISLIVITYNSSKYILETLYSCSLQTYKNIELIISDDASTDNTIELCENWLNQFGSKFTHCKIIRSAKNTGIAGNANRGVAEAKGEWLKFLAGDDVLLPESIEYGFNKVKNLAIDREVIAYCTPAIPFKVINGERQLLENKNRKRPHFYHPALSADDQFQMAIRNMEQPSIAGFFLKRKVYEEAGGCDERFPMLEDRPLVLRILKQGYRLDGDDHPTVMYRIHDESVYRTGQKEKLVREFTIKYYIPVRKAYFLPHYSFIEVWAYRWQFFVEKLFYTEFLNKRSTLNIELKKLLLLPFEWFRRGVKYYWVWKIEKKITLQAHKNEIKTLKK